MEKSGAKAIETPDQYRSLGFPGADGLGNISQFKRDFTEYYCGTRSPEFARRLKSESQTFDAWPAKNKSLTPLAAPQEA